MDHQEHNNFNRYPLVMPLSDDLVPNISWWHDNNTISNGSISSSYDETNATDYEFEININDSSITAANTSNSVDDAIFILAVKTLQFLNFYYLGAMIAVGVLGNGLNFVSFICTRNKLRSPSYYLASLALSDAVFLAVLFIIWLNQLDIDLFDRPVVYKIFVYFSAFSSCISAWLVVAFTFERLIVVRYPLRRHKICTIRRAKIIIASLTAATGIVQILSLYTTGLIEQLQQIDNATVTTLIIAEGDLEATNNRTDVISSEMMTQTIISWGGMFPSYYKVMRILAMLETAVTLVIPPILIFGMNALIIHGLFQFNRTIKQHTIKQHSFISRLDTVTLIDGGHHLHEQNIQMDTIRGADCLLQSNQHNSSSVNSGVMQSNSSSGHVQKYINTFAIVESAKQKHGPSSHVHHTPLSSSDSGNRLHDLPQPTMISSTPNQQHQAGCSGSSSYASAAIEVEEQSQESRNRNHPLDTSTCDVHTPSSIAGIIMMRASHVHQRALETHLDIDAIQLDPSQPSPQQQEQVTQSVLVGNHPFNSSYSSTLIRNNTNNVDLIIRHTTAASSTPNEYTITKKLVIISTIHILLNLPTYAMDLKVFINETITSNTEITSLTWILQQYAMLLYYTNFAINFLLYSSSNVTFRYQFFTWCKQRLTQQQRQVVIAV